MNTPIAQSIWNSLRSTERYLFIACYRGFRFRIVATGRVDEVRKAAKVLRDFGLIHRDKWAATPLGVDVMETLRPGYKPSTNSHEGLY